VPRPSHALAALLVCAGWLVLAWPWLSGSVTIPWDAKAQTYPQLQFLAASLHRGESPAWTPFAFAGWPQIADPQSLILSPAFLALAALTSDPSFQAADAAVLVSLLVGALALALHFRDRGWAGAGALVAALAFAFGASAAWRLQHLGQVTSLALWPVAHLLLWRALDRGSLAYGAAAGLAAAVMALGRDQVAMLALWVLAFQALAGLVPAPRRALKPLAAGALVGVGVLAVPLALTALLAEVSNRPSIDYAGAARGSLHPALLLTAVVPNLFGADGPFMDYWGPPSPRWGTSDLVLARNMGVLYIGALPVALLALGLARGVLWAREVRVLAGALALMTLYALGQATPVFAGLFRAVPGVDLFRRPADATFLMGALAATLAGYVAHRWWTGTLPPAGRGRRLLEVALLALPFAAALLVAAAKGTLALAAWPLATAAAFMGLAVLALARLRSRGTPALLVLAALLVADLRVNNGPNESTGLDPAVYDVLRPASADPLIAALKARLGEGLDRVELAGLGFHWPNASLVHRLHNTLGYNPLRLAAYAQATGAEDHVAVPDQRRFAPLMPSYRSPLADLLGLRFIATGAPIETIDPALRPGDLVPLGRIGEAHLYENPRAMPRAFLAGEARAADFAAILATGRWPEVDLARTVLLEEAPPAGPTATGTARVVAYGTTRVDVEVEASGPAHLVLNDPHHPWWEASVDGAPAPVLRANVLFRAVPVPAGRSLVRFRFRPLAGAWRQIRGADGR
jgi:hypothetical protein